MPMISIEKLRNYMQAQAEVDRKQKSVTVSGADIEDALRQASIELGIPMKKLEYEILEAGSKGMMGFGKKPCLIIAYETVPEVKTASFDEEFAQDFSIGQEAEEEEKDKDGEAFVRLTPDGVFLKVTPPKGEGKRATEKQAFDALARRGITNYDKAMVSRVVKHADDEYIRVGEFIYNPANDAALNVDITDQEMKAYIMASPPGPGGADLTFESIVSVLKHNGVIYGLLEGVVKDFVDKPKYNQPILVAEGKKPVHGKDAKIIYNFETDNTKARLKEKDGKVDFKELNLVQNVVEGQVLARKTEAEMGDPGRTVTGKMIPAKDGSDRQIGIGKNVRLSEDGKSAISEINGQVLIVADKINVEPIYTVPGDVNLKTGNILFLGTVMIKGNVDDGFSVKAAGNIEILGAVGKCMLDAEGDIIVHQGITGKMEGTVKCGHSLWAKYIENASVEAGEYVVVSDGIINSNVDANKKIICRGKRATIVGGNLRAAEEINAKTLGSVAGGETILQVGYDPRAKERLDVNTSKKEALEHELEDINLNLNTLKNLKKTKKTLPEDKMKYAMELSKKKASITKELEKLEKEIEETQAYLATLKNQGRISCSGKVYPGVKIFIKEANLDVRSEFKAVTFINEANIVKVTKYEEPEDDVARRE